jgi:hypothetical protein
MNNSIIDRNEHQIILQNYLFFQLDGNLIMKNITDRFSIHRIYIGTLDKIIKDHFNGENFLGCIKNLMFNNKPLIQLKHIEQSNRLTNTCQLTKRERK